MSEVQRFHLRYGTADFFSGNQCRLCREEVGVGKVEHVLQRHHEVLELPPLP